MFTVITTIVMVTSERTVTFSLSLTAVRCEGLYLSQLSLLE